MKEAVIAPGSDVRLLALGDTAWTVEFGEVIDPVVHARVQGLAEALDKRREAAGKGQDEGGWTPYTAVVDVVPTFRSLTVHFDPLRCDGQRLGDELLALARSTGSSGSSGRCWRIPVCFDDDCAPDLADLAQSKGLTRDTVIDLMTRTEFQVYMIGFMPGFPYMGGLPAELQMPRLASPRKAVPERSLAVAGEMCAVYPWESPGGWRLLGRTPVPMFQASDSQPALLASGDRVRWQAVDRTTYIELERAGQAGTLDRRAFLVTDEGAHA